MMKCNGKAQMTLKLFRQAWWSVPNHMNKIKRPNDPVRKKRIKSKTEKKPSEALTKLNTATNKNKIVKIKNGESKAGLLDSTVGVSISSFCETDGFLSIIVLSNPFSK